MPLSVEEIDTAKKAYADMRNFESNRFLAIGYGGLLALWILLFGTSSASGTPDVADGKYLRYWEAVPPMHFIIGHSYFFMLLLLAVGPAINCLLYRSKYTEGLKVLTGLEEKYLNELPFGLESEIEKLKAAEKRPLLWRLDAFLSRKPTNN
jgi:hypothetical protein